MAFQIELNDSRKIPEKEESFILLSLLCVYMIAQMLAKNGATVEMKTKKRKSVEATVVGTLEMIPSIKEIL